MDAQAGIKEGMGASHAIHVRIPLILINQSGRSRSPIPVILITLFTMPEGGMATA